MKTKIILIIVLSLFVQSINAQNIYKKDKTVIVYLHKNEASKYLEKTNYFSEQNRLSVSLKTKGSIKYEDVNFQDKYKEYVFSNLQNWKKNEKKYLNERFSNILPYIQKYTKSIIQDTIYLIKSKKIEFSAPFTKGKAIILHAKDIPPFFFKGMGKIKKDIEHTLIHEMFHIYSSNNINKRERIYNLIGFEKINSLNIPNNIQKMLIINPDDNISDYYKIRFSNQDYVLLILSKYPKYEGCKNLISRLNILLGYLEIKLFRIEQQENGTWEIKNDKRYNRNSEFYKKLGFHHHYNLSPEEIVAEDYAKLIELKMYPKELEELSEDDKAFFNEFESILQ